jgi:hypothetical protein
MKPLVARIGTAAATMMFFLGFALVCSEVIAQTPKADTEKEKEKAKSASAQPKVKLGLSINDPKAFRGYTLLNPMNKKTAYLIDMEGRIVNTWESQQQSMQAAYLLENGHLFRLATLGGEDRAFGGGPGAAGRIQEFDWDGQLVWDFKFYNDKQLPHHDAMKMPSGNVLMVVWDKKTAAQAIAAGRKKELVSDYLLPDSVVEVKPTGKTTGEVVWEWHLWDHLVQDHDSTKANFGEVAAHPELVDINFAESSLGGGPGGPPPPAKNADPDKKKAMEKEKEKDAAKKAEAAKLKSLGYVGSPTQRSQRVNPDWTHVNSIDFNPELDQIVLSNHEFSEFWIIDHSTTTAEAAGHKGGKSGKGGDLLYCWGNPRVYRAGTKADQTLFAQHNVNWIGPGLPGAGRMLVFNNGARRPDGNYSSIDEIELPVDSQGHYAIEPGKAFGPKKATWSYSAPKKTDFFATFISGTHRLPNGNTMICSGPNGTLFEVTPQKEIVWKYINPVKGGFGPGNFGGPGGAGGGPPRPNQVLPPFMQDMLGLTAEQKKEFESLQKTVDETLDKSLTDEQKKTLRARNAPGPGGPGSMPVPGQFMSVATQLALKPTSEQKTKLAALQKEVDARMESVLKADQKTQLKQLRADFARFAPGGGGGPGPGGPGGPGGGGPPPGLFAGPPGGGGVFRAYRYGPDYAGLSGKMLKPGMTIEELDAKEAEKTKSSEKAKDAAKK